MNTEIVNAENVVRGDYLHDPRLKGTVTDIIQSLEHWKVGLAVDGKREFINFRKSEKMIIKQR